MISVLVFSVIGIFLIGYLTYGRFLAKKAQLDNSRITPACRINDGIDYVPARASLLLGQHFSAIAAAGPIVGPILACLWFGWLPAMLWIVLGAIFIGGAHDFFSLIASVRHDGESVGEIVKKYMSSRSYLFFLIFVWLALVYVIIAFTDITAHTFKTISGQEAYGPGVASSSLLYLLAAMVLGFLLRFAKIPLWLATLIFLPIVLFIIWAGPRLPESILAPLSNISVKGWDVIILVYCLAASLVPVWVLLQPRGYLGGWFLYLVILIGLMGALLGGFMIEYPAVSLEGLKSTVNGKSVFPLLFITIACGACSGFHGVVSAGTTSKQIAREKDCFTIGYGAMLLEGVVGILAMATVIMLPAGSAILKSDPNMIYADGIARYLGLVGLKYNIAFPFALLAFSTFVYDTLDVCTRLARYIFAELTGWRSKTGVLGGAVICVLVPFVFLMLTREKGYLVAWPIFGSSNQLLASLTLLAVSVWLIKLEKKALITILPMLFMLVVTIWSLAGMVVPFVAAMPKLLNGGGMAGDVAISGLCSVVLLFLSLMFVWEAAKQTLFRTGGKGYR